MSETAWRIFRPRNGNVDDTWWAADKMAGSKAENAAAAAAALDGKCCGVEGVATLVPRSDGKLT